MMANQGLQRTGLTPGALSPVVAAPMRRSGNAARIKDPLADLHFATVNQRIERTTTPPSTLDSASAAHPRVVPQPIDPMPASDDCGRLSVYSSSRRHTRRKRPVATWRPLFRTLP
jgi:hypothetical protein